MSGDAVSLGESSGMETGVEPADDGTETEGDDGAGEETGGDADPDTDVPDPVEVRLFPQAGHGGWQRVNFAVPLARGQLFDADALAVHHEGVALGAATRPLARYPDGSIRSVQVQIDLDVSEETAATVVLGESPTRESLDFVPVHETLVVPDGTQGPRVWALLPAAWLSGSGVAGPMAPAQDFESTPSAAWLSVCDYEKFDTEAFLAVSDSPGPWLYDRGTAMARGYAMTGDLTPLRSQYRETSLYRSGLTGSGADIRISIPNRVNDAKYHYTQNLAIHYLLTGDDRFREAARDIAGRMHQLWPNPGYAGGSDFWTERHAGFALLAYVWAAAILDDDDDEIWAWADEAVEAYLAVQDTYPIGYDDPDARCFAHHAQAADEPFGYFGCSPWLSAILADGLEQYAIERGGDRADAAWDSVVKLGRVLATQGTDGSGKPWYWIGVGSSQHEIDPYDEHWGESAYVLAMAYHRAPLPEPELLHAAEALIDGFAAHAVTPHVRSFNWQCRSAVATPYYLLHR